ncbi:DUF4349 domain-containing protein [Actinomadura macrotermitis]|uniref:DUF4349 domain-containing protein n=1 Tax=Actinomadura macrotermitis TaxID=2585200 RepID=A0A7K0C4B3_9ACTN|nr:DUF4349 domain-containing protein [Actinomadura macrotermitis]MQY07952.1 hypothetical protein [Actinomadura macrotermitis]
MRTIRLALCALFALLLATLTACAGAGGRDNASSGLAQKERAGGPAAAAKLPTGGAKQTSARTASPPGRAVIYTATLRVRAKDVDAAAARAKQLTAAAGGYVDNETSTTSPAGSTLVLKIPSGGYPAALDQLAGQLGTKLALSQKADDVTEQVADVDSRVRSAQASLQSFRKLLDKATSISDITSLEEQIERRQADLESLQARQRALRQSTQFATVTVHLEAQPAAARKPEKRGFLAALGEGWDAFTALVTALTVLFGWLLPFLVVALLLALPLVLFRHRLRARFARRPAGPRPDGPASGAPRA